MIHIIFICLLIVLSGDGYVEHGVPVIEAKDVKIPEFNWQQELELQAEVRDKYQVYVEESE